MVHPMTTPLRVILLEDAATDAELIVHELRRSGFAPEWRRVDDEASFRKALREGADLVLADYSLPQFNAREALRVRAEEEADVPVIVVTGSLEESALECVREGAADYLLKDRLARLGPAVERVMERQRLATERQRAEHALRLSEERFRLALSHAPVFVSHQDEQLHYVWAYNPPRALFGERELIGCTDADFMSAEEADALSAIKRQVLVHGKGIRQDVKATSADGNAHYFDLVAEPLRGAEGEVTGLTCVMTDVTERRRMEQTVRQGRERYRALFDANPFPMWVVDLELLSFLAVNDAAVQKYGYSREEFLQLALDDIGRGVPSLTDRLAPASEPRAVRTLAGEHRLKNGATITVEALVDTIVFGGRQAWLMAVNDISERAAIEEHFRQAQKMDAVGRLAGGVAHDFNNLLTVITGYCDLTIERLAPGDPHLKPLGEVRKAADRARDLTRQLLTFSRKKPLELRALSVNDVITGLTGMLRRLVGEDVVVEESLAPSLGNILADRGLIEQVLVNLAVNARDAMPVGGTLSISTIDVPGAMPAEAADPHVILAVSDTGTGMPPEVVARVFEPFFTTKDPGKGTGLGLSTVYGIVKQLGGSIQVSSVPGAGTSFRIRLPRTEALIEPEVAAEASSSGSCRSETVLLVEDDECVRNMAAIVLEREGYRVLPAASAEEATRVAEHEPVDLLLTDVVLPGAGARQLIDWLDSTCPDIARICMSGHSGDQVDECRAVCAGYIEKPFSPAVLSRKVREVLDARGR
jgi:two-component system, cell cycle sensor histidine kinase and response regulator CckA